MQPVLRYSFQKSSLTFDSKFSSSPEEEKQTAKVGDLAPGDHWTLITTSNVNLAHEHDVAAVLSGEYTLYIFGKVPYKDVLNNDHEFHFCRQVTAPVTGADPLKPMKCGMFNYSY